MDREALTELIDNQLFLLEKKKKNRDDCINCINLGINDLLYEIKTKIEQQSKELEKSITFCWKGE